MTEDFAESQAAPNWQPLAHYLEALLGRAVVQGNKHRSEDPRELVVHGAEKYSIGLQLPPYRAEELAAADLEWVQLPASDPLQGGTKWVVGFDTSRDAWLLRLGIDAGPANLPVLVVRWPACWPITHLGRGRIALQPGFIRHAC